MNESQIHSTEEVKMLCQGKNRQGNPCGKHAILGRAYCRNHGGRTPIGPASPTYKHGRRSKYVPTRIAAKYEEAMSDPELADIRHSIALLEIRADELLASGESHLLWNKARTAFDDLMALIKDQDEAGIKAGMRVLDDLLRRGHEDSLRWQEWYRVTEQHGRMVEREHKRMAYLESYITMEQVLVMMGLIANIAAQTIQDKDSLKRFTAAVDAMVIGKGGWH